MPEDFAEFQAQQDLNILEEAEKIEGDARRVANVKGMAERIAKRVGDLNFDEADANIEAMKAGAHITLSAKDVGM